MAESWHSGTVRNTQFLRLEHKIPLHPPAARAAHTVPENDGRLRAHSGRYTGKAAADAFIPIFPIEFRARSIYNRKRPRFLGGYFFAINLFLSCMGGLYL